MKFISFNVNGLRSRTHQLTAVIEKYAPDVIGLQETKVHDEMFPEQELRAFGYHLAYHGQKGHYGVALLTKQQPLAIHKGFSTDDDEAQRRLIMTELATPIGNMLVINGYFPQGEARDHPIKFPAKAKFYADLQHYLQQNSSTTPLLLVMGDMNVCPADNDIGIAAESKKRWLKSGKSSFLPEEQQWLNNLMEQGLFDTFRQLHPDVNDRFSWFDYRSRGFDSNSGLRIDLILASKHLLAHCISSGIDYDIRAMEKPSDHAPVWAEFNFNHQL